MRTPIFALNAKKFTTNLAIVLMLVFLSCFAFYGISSINSSTQINGAYYGGNEKSGKVCLMINVYWGTEYLPEMLEILKNENVKATFFVGGTWAVKESEMLEKIYQDGHEIANHGYSHKDADKLSASQCIKEIADTHNIVKQLLGVEMNLYAPPSGDYNKKTIEIANELGYKTIMWSAGKDTIDWRDKNSDLIYSRATKNIKSGDFILMHPTEATKNALEKIIRTIKERGLDFCKISENLI